MPSGKYGTVNGQPGVKQWSVSPTSNPNKTVASNTKAGPIRRPGIRDWSGSFACNGRQPLVFPGQIFTFAGYTAPTDGVLSHNGVIWSGTAIVDQVVLTWDYKAGAIIGYTITFSGNGPLAHASGAPYNDNSAPALDEAINVSISAGSATVCNVTQITLTLSTANPSSVTSCTAGWTARDAGPFDATLAIAMEDVDNAQFVSDIGAQIQFKLYVDSTHFWDIRWMHFKELSNISVNVETGEFIGYTANFEFTGFSPDGTTQGGIVAPDTTTRVWGTATP